MNVSIRQLEAFVKVVDNLSFSKAGEELFLSQSTISCHVAQLERTLQATLLERTEKKNIKPTERGMQVYRAAVQVLRQMEALEGMFRQEEEAHPLISIAASTIPARYILPELLAGYAAAHPSHRFSVMEGDSAFALERLGGGEATFAFTGTKSSQSAFVYQVLCQDRMVLITPNTAEYQKKQQDGVLGRTLLDRPIIMREKGSGTRRETDIYLTGMGINPLSLNVAAYMNDLEAIKRMVASGVGVTILSEWAAEDAVKAGSVLSFPMERDGLYRELYFVYAKGRHLSHGEQVFLKYVKKYGESMAAGNAGPVEEPDDGGAEE